MSVLLQIIKKKKFHYLEKLAFSNPQRAMDLLARMDNNNEINLASCINNAIYNGDVIRLNNLVAYWSKRLLFNIDNQNVTMVNQDTIISHKLSAYRQKHSPEEWCRVYPTHKTYNVKPISSSDVLCILNTVVSI